METNDIPDAAFEVLFTQMNAALKGLSLPSASVPAAFLDRFPYDPDSFRAYRLWNLAITDDGPRLRSPFVRSSLPHGYLWVSSEYSAICPVGCVQAPGPCGGRGAVVIARPDHLLRFRDNYPHFEGALICGKMQVEGEVMTVPLDMQVWPSCARELRAHKVVIESLCVRDEVADHAGPLADYYGVPVRVGVTLDNLTAL
ncbi:hypothetical protein [Nocardia sp. NPDC051463]|uniref:hypothetical protein n=1 Tax=Nocardia sp. NPDC051463 TaxID=3154845 RepID=UPI00344E9C62